MFHGNEGVGSSPLKILHLEDVVARVVVVLTVADAAVAMMVVAVVVQTMIARGLMQGSLPDLEEDQP
jgi:hypothetical protein